MNRILRQFNWRFLLVRFLVNAIAVAITAAVTAGLPVFEYTPTAVKQALVKAGIAPHEALIIGGIGCGSKFPDYATVNGFMTLHGRTLPVATGARLAKDRAAQTLTQVEVPAQADYPA